MHSFWTCSEKCVFGQCYHSVLIGMHLNKLRGLWVVLWCNKMVTASILNHIKHIDSEFNKWCMYVVGPEVPKDVVVLVILVWQNIWQRQLKSRYYILTFISWDRVHQSRAWKVSRAGTTWSHCMKQDSTRSKWQMPICISCSFPCSSWDLILWNTTNGSQGEFCHLE